MELKTLCEEILKIFGAEDILGLGEKLLLCVTSNDIDKFAAFEYIVKDLSVDWLQKIFQYYAADREEKKQDFTPKTLADFMGKLVGDSESTVDMCAGSGALTIQKWNQNHDSEFFLYEFDENVIPFLLFNMAVRNISCTVYHADVLQQEAFRAYKITKGDKYGIFEEIEHEKVFDFQPAI